MDHRPNGAKSLDLWFCALSGALALTVYRLTQSFMFTWQHWGADGGDFIAAAATGRWPHPPGFPLYMALARAAFRLSHFHNPARRLNDLSSMMGALAVVAMAWLALRRGARPVVAVALALTIGFAPLLWSQALITEVYTTAAACVALALVAAEAGSAFGAGLGWGMALAVHPTTIFLAPWLWSRRAHAPLRYVQFVVGLALALSLYALPLLGATGPEPWADFRTLSGWLNYVTARLYWGYAFALPLAEWPGRMLAWAALMARQFTPVGALLVLYGLTCWWQRRRGEVVGWLAAWGGISLYAIGYNTPDSLVYLVGLFPLMIFPLVEGARGLEKAVRRIANPSRRNTIPLYPPVFVGLLLLPLALLVLNWGALNVWRMDVSAGWVYELNDAPPDAVVLVSGDRHTFALWYAQEALALRPDVLVVGREMWGLPSYRAFLAERAGVVVAEPKDFAVERPLCEAGEEGLRCQ